MFSVLAVSDSVSQAAERLFVSQQALSKTLAQLEQEIGQPLIYRHAHSRQRLTPAGELLLRESRKLLQAARELETGLQLTPMISPAVQLGSVLVLDEELSAVLARTEAPLIQHQAFFEAAAELEQALLNQALDLGLLCHPPASPQLTAVRIKRSPYVILGNPAVFSGSWEPLPYIRVKDCFGDQSPLHVWPEQHWPRRVIAEADMNMAMALCARGVGCLHFPDCFYPFRLPGARLSATQSVTAIATPPFAADYQRYLVWSDALTAAARQARNLILQAMGISESEAI